MENSRTLLLSLEEAEHKNAEFAAVKNTDNKQSQAAAFVVMLVNFFF
jgi:hypothetical protein